MEYAKYMHYDPSDHIGKALAGGGYEQDLLRYVIAELQQIASDEIIIDVGAHFGNFACAVSGDDGPGGQILAFEPNPVAFAFLEKNADEFYFDAYNFAVTDEMMSCSIEAGPPGNSGMAKVVEGGDIPCVFLDDMLETDDEKASVVCIKIDVEGSELAVLRTATEILRASRPMVICEAQTQEKFDEIDGFLSNFGYQWTGKRFCATPTYVWR